MNDRERHLATWLFGQPDRLPLAPGHGRQSTLAAWHRQGLPADVQDYNEYAYRLAGGTLPWPSGGVQFAVNERMIPTFPELVLEELPTSRIVQDWKGNVCEIGKEFTPEYLRNAIDFVTRRWLKCPVTNRAEWADLQRRYEAMDPARLPADPVAAGQRLRDRRQVLQLHFSGPFWQLREWVGFEQLCLLLHDDPAFVHEMVDFWDDYIARLLQRALACVTPDVVHLSEDMAYKSFAMISPAMTREFLLPTWRHWGELVRAAGVPVYAMDSDGYVGELIPLWIEAGINVCDPLEVAAGNNLPAFRRQFGRAMAYSGGVDKRAMAQGGAAIAAEIARLRPVMADGGYLPSCDHGVPADVTWPHYVAYVGQLAAATGWL